VRAFMGARLHATPAGAGVFSAMKQLAWAVMFLRRRPGARRRGVRDPALVRVADASTLPVQGSIYVHHEMMARYGASELPPQPSVRWTGAASPCSSRGGRRRCTASDYDAHARIWCRAAG